jgi:hypothetical protein
MDLTINFLLLLIFLGMLAAFIDSSFGMGYGLLTPIMIILGFEPLLIVPVLLFSQMASGFSGTIFHSLYKNVELDSKYKKDVKVTFIFTFSGMLGIICAVFIAINLRELFLFLYIGIMLIIVGIIMIFKIHVEFSWSKLYLISGLAAFNKAITGGGYGPIATTGQLVTGRDHKEAIAVSNLSEAFLSGFGFLLYFVLEGFQDLNFIFLLLVIMSISGIIITPLGALVPKKIDKRKAKISIGFMSIILGIISLIRIFWYI